MSAKQTITRTTIITRIRRNSSGKSNAVGKGKSKKSKRCPTCGRYV